MSKAMEGGKSSALESTKKRTPHITPTHRQLAYLDELKTHLLLMRERQAIFMEQTAKMLTGISTVNMVGNSVLQEPATGGEEVAEGEAQASKSNPNIKKLIQRFEDLRQSSQKFTDLPDVPEELVNVDVRRILKGYEKLIEEGNIIQQSWLLLKNSTERSVRVSTNRVLTTFEDQANPTNLTKTDVGIAEVFDVTPKTSMPVILPQDEGPTSGAEFAGNNFDAYEIKTNAKDSSTAKNRGHARWGPFMRLLIRLLKPLPCGSKSSKKTAEICSSSMIAYEPPKKTKKTKTRKARMHQGQPDKMHK